MSRGGWRRKKQYEDIRNAPENSGNIIIRAK
jgi:hypothetical protein